MAAVMPADECCKTVAVQSYWPSCCTRAALTHKTSAAVFTANVSQASQSLQRLAGLDWRTAWCSHDAGKGVSQAVLRASVGWSAVE